MNKRKIYWNAVIIHMSCCMVCALLMCFNLKLNCCLIQTKPQWITTIIIQLTPNKKTHTHTYHKSVRIKNKNWNASSITFRYTGNTNTSTSQYTSFSGSKLNKDSTPVTTIYDRYVCLSIRYSYTICPFSSFFFTHPTQISIPHSLVSLKSSHPFISLWHYPYTSI